MEIVPRAVPLDRLPQTDVRWFAPAWPIQQTRNAPPNRETRTRVPYLTMVAEAAARGSQLDGELDRVEMRLISRPSRGLLAPGQVVVWAESAWLGLTVTSRSLCR